MTVLAFKCMHCPLPPVHTSSNPSLSQFPGCLLMRNSRHLPVIVRAECIMHVRASTLGLMLTGEESDREAVC